MTPKGVDAAVIEFELGEEMPLTVVATAAVGDSPEVDVRFILDLHSQTEDLHLYFSDPEPLRLLRQAANALLRQSRRFYPHDCVVSHAFKRRPLFTQRHIDFSKLDQPDELSG